MRGIIIIVFCLGLVSTLLSQTTKKLSYPIPGIPFTLNTLISEKEEVVASGISDLNGRYEFNDLETSEINYFIKIALKQNAKDSSPKEFKTKNFTLLNSNDKTKPIVIIEIFEDYELTLTITKTPNSPFSMLEVCIFKLHVASK